MVKISVFGLNPNSEVAGVIRWDFDHGFHGFYGFKDASNRFGVTISAFRLLALVEGAIHALAEAFERGLIELEKHLVATLAGFEQSRLPELVDVPRTGRLRQRKGIHDVHARNLSPARQILQNADPRRMGQGLGKPRKAHR